jgi:hypothetical protein
VYGEDDAVISTWQDDSKDPRFGLPLTYTLKRTTGKREIGKPCHWSRVIHVADGLLDDRVYGQPRLERVWNDLDNLDKVVGGGSEAFWLRVHQGMQVNIDKDTTVTPAELEAMKLQVDEFEHGMRRTLTTRGVNAEMFGSDVSNFGNQVDALISLISGATGVPQRLLLGSERGELASTQDKANWDERVQDRRDDFAWPVVLKPFVQRLIEAGALPDVDFQPRWPEIDELDDTAKAIVADKWSKLNTQAGGLVVKPEEIRDRVLGLDALAPKDIAEWEEAHQPAVDPNPMDDPDLEDMMPEGRAAAARGPKVGSQSGPLRTSTLRGPRVS